MKYSNTYKQSLVKRHKGGESVAQICYDTSIARSTLYSWINAIDVIDPNSHEPITMQEYNRVKQRM